MKSLGTYVCLSYPKHMYLHIHVCMHLHMHKYQCLSLQLSLEGPYPGYFYRGVYLKNRDQIINGGMISHASTENTRILGGSGGILTPEKSLNLRSLDYWKYIEIVNSTITTLFCILLNILQFHQRTFFGSWRGACTLRAPPVCGPALVSKRFLRIV